MAGSRSLSRRKFLELIGLAASATALGACTPRAVQVVVTATPSPVPPTPTPLPPPLTIVEPGGFEMVLVEAGSFEMGSASGRANEQPVHRVNITRNFYMAKTETAVEQYEIFCQDTAREMPAGFGTRPVVVSWYDATAYCNWLSERAGLTPCYVLARESTECDFLANGYRLPTEAEWEYAARGGNRSEGYLYAGSNHPGPVGWYEDNAVGYRRPVGEKMPNELGLYDMSGNLREWCWDWYEKDYYSVSPTDDPSGPALVREHFADVNKVRRGGCFDSWADELRTTYRTAVWPQRMGTTTGMRIVRTE
jgi:sulfatase modifying factor 1